MQEPTPAPRRRTIIAALAALGAAVVSVPLASPANAAPISHDSPAEAHLNIGVASTEKFPGYPF